MRPETGRLYLDFHHQGVRCREQTALMDTPANRRTLEGLASRIRREQSRGSFIYRTFFPDSPRAATFEPDTQADVPAAVGTHGGEPETPSFADFAEAWFAENKPRWRTSHAETIRGILDGRLLPSFGGNPVGSITRAEILSFRAAVASSSKRKGQKKLSASRVNHIMTALRMILADAADRHNLVSPFRNIKPMRLPRQDIEPFSLDEVERLIETIRDDYRPYLVTRFYTGLRTGEINALEWKFIDLDNDLIRIRQSVVKGVIHETKNSSSSRDVPMVAAVRRALLDQRERVAADCRWVFPAPQGGPISVSNFTNRVWQPLLRHLDMAPRRPYQTRHTAATLMLAAGENPEWVAHVLGQSSTEMLFRVYSRYVPNLTRNDGRAFSHLVTAGSSLGKRGSALPSSLTALSRTQLETLVRELGQIQRGDTTDCDA